MFAGGTEVKIFATSSVDWQQLKGAFGAAAEALVAAIPPDLSPIEVSLSKDRSVSVRLTDSPMARSAIACADWFPAGADAESGILRIWALLALLPQIPTAVLFEPVEEAAREDDPAMRDEIFIVAATIPLTRRGKFPPEKFLRQVRTLIETRADKALRSQ